MIDTLNKIESVMYGREKPGLFLRIFLDIASFLYSIVMRLRLLLYEKGWLKTMKLPCPVISVGNLTLGGTGKTPVAVYVAKLLHKQGKRPAIVTRGYRGGFEKRGGVVSNGKRVLASPQDAGDEPYCTAISLPGVPVLVGRDRFKSGMRAIREMGANIVILDDGFQHMKIFRNLDILLVDGASPFGNNKVFPAGVLREPAFSIKRAGIILGTRVEDNTQPAIPETKAPVFRTRHKPYRSLAVLRGELAQLSFFPQPDEVIAPEGTRFFVFSGIADNNSFMKSIEQSGFHVSGFHGFPDHHDYTKEDIELIIQMARESSADAFATTEKDFVKLFSMVWPMDIYVLGVTIEFLDKGKEFAQMLKDV